MFRTKTVVGGGESGVEAIYIYMYDSIYAWIYMYMLC